MSDHLSGKIIERGRGLYDAEGTKLLIEQCSECRKIIMDALNQRTGLEALCRSLASALKDWQQFDTESSDKHPCPDAVLRAAYRKRARAATDIALAEYKNLLGD